MVVTYGITRSVHPINLGHKIEIRQKNHTKNAWKNVTEISWQKTHYVFPILPRLFAFSVTFLWSILTSLTYPGLQKKAIFVQLKNYSYSKLLQQYQLKAGIRSNQKLIQIWAETNQKLQTAISEPIFKELQNTLKAALIHKTDER